MEVTVDREEVVCEVEEGQGAANSPYVNGLSEGQAEGNFWSSLKGTQVCKNNVSRKNLWRQRLIKKPAGGLCRTWKYLYPMGCVSIPGFAFEIKIARPKSINLILSGCSLLLTSITLSGLMSVCRTPTFHKVFKATKSCSKKEEKKILSFEKKCI